MKHVLIFAACILSLSFVLSEDQCGPDSTWTSSHNVCKFRCTPDGVELDCSSIGCQCNDYELYYNADTKQCTEVNCDNLNCAGRENEFFFGGCESGSRDRCGCSPMVTMDCNRGCMCKNGFCRKGGRCVPRGCSHPFYN